MRSTTKTKPVRKDPPASAKRRSVRKVPSWIGSGKDKMTIRKDADLTKPTLPPGAPLPRPRSVCRTLIHSIG